MKLLIVDDHEQNRYMLQVLLEGHGHQVASAKDGAEALDMARRDPPGMIISDVLMPGMDGFALCREWKKDAELRTIPFVFYTATYTDPKDKEFALSLGAERFIVKPQEPDVFMDMVQEIFENHEEGRLVPLREPVEEEKVFFREYNEVLIRKLEDKLVQLEEANQALEREIADHKQAEEQSRRQAAILSALLNSPQETVALLDADGIVLTINLNGAKRFGLPPEEMMGKNVYALIPEPVSGERKRIISGVMQTGQPAQFEDQRQGMHFMNSIYPVNDPQSGELLGAAIFAIDITARKQAEEALRVSEEKYRTLVEGSLQGVVIAQDEPVRLTFANAAMESLCGYSVDDLLSMGPSELAGLVHPEDRERFFGNFRRRLAGEPVPHVAEYRLLRRDGETIWVTCHSSAIDYFGQPATLTAFVDITARVQAEAQLRESEEKYRSLFNQSTEGIYLHDLEGRILDVNEMACAQSGYSREEWLRRTVFDGHPSKSTTNLPRDEILRMWQEWAPGQQYTMEAEHQHKDGAVYPVEISTGIVRYKGENAILAIVKDITARKQAEARMQHLTQVLRAIRDVNQLIVHEQDRDALLRRACEILVSTRGYRSAWAALRGEDGAAQTVAESGIGEDFAPVRQALARGDWPACCRQAQEQPDNVVPIHDTDRNCTTCRLAHTYRDIAALAGALRHGGRDYGALVVALPAGLADAPEEQSLFRELVGDVAYALYSIELARAREEAEQALRASEERFRVAQEMSPDGFTILHPLRNEKGEVVDFAWVYENQAAARINGTDPKDVIGKRLLDLFPTHRGTAVFEAYLHVANTGKTRILEEVYVGEIVSIPTWLRLVVVSMGEDIASLAHDITERKRAEEALHEKAFLIDSSSVIIGTCDLDSRMTYANPAFLQDLGYERLDEILERPFGEFWMVQDRLDEIMAALTSDGGPGRWAGELQVRRKDGSLFDVYAAAVTVPDRFGKPMALMSTSIDITERKKAEEELRKYREHLEELVKERTAKLRQSEEQSRAQYKGIPVPTYTWQKVGDDILLVDYNAAAEALTQGKIADLVGIELREMYRDTPEIREEIERCFAEQTTIEREMPYRFRSSGEERHLAVKYAFVPPDLVLVHTEDITERVRAEEELRKQAAELKRLVNLMAGREVRMAELKDVIRQLRAQLEEAGLAPVADDPLLGGS